jgi:hypothetical protein
VIAAPTLRAARLHTRADPNEGGFMRAVLILLAVLVAAKVWAQDKLHRDAANEALLAAYKLHAQSACVSRPQTDARGMPVAVGSVNWKQPETAEVLLGNPRLSVPIWQLEHPLWNARFKNPVVRLTVGDRFSRIACDYDVMTGKTDLLVL